MDKLETFKALMPFIPIRYRRPLLLFLHIDELMRIINSMNECLNAPMNVMEEKPADMSKLLEILKGNMSKDDSDMMSMLLPLLMSGGLSGGDGLSSLLSGFTSGLSGSSDENKNSTDNRNTDTHNNDNYDNNTCNNNNYNNNNHNHDNNSEFSDEIDDLFKDFINETGNDNYE